MKWDWNRFFIKLNSAALWAWMAWMVLTFIVCIKGGNFGWIKTEVIGCIIVSGLFIGGKVLIDALAIAFSKAEIKANLTIGGGVNYDVERNSGQMV